MNNLCPTVDNFLKIVDAFQSNYLNFSNICVTHTHTHTHTHTASPIHYINARAQYIVFQQIISLPQPFWGIFLRSLRAFFYHSHFCRLWLLNRGRQFIFMMKEPLI